MSVNGLQDITVTRTLGKKSRVLAMNSKSYVTCPCYPSDLTILLICCPLTILTSLLFLKHPKYMPISVNAPPTDIHRVPIFTSFNSVFKCCFLNTLYEIRTSPLHPLTLDSFYHCITYYYNYIYVFLNPLGI